MAVAAVAFFVYHRDADRPVRIGYIGGLTGHVADLGVAGRDGVLLAVELRNASGGVAGRRVELLIQDDGQEREQLQRGLRSLIDRGAAGIVGPMTSQMSVDALPLLAQTGAVVISPTASSAELSGLDDTFLRVYPNNEDACRQLADEVAVRRGYQRVGAIYDLSNRAFTESWFVHTTSRIKEQGGRLVSVETFESNAAPMYEQLAARTMATQPDCVLIFASAMDTAMLCQQLHRIKPELPIAVAEWSATEEALEFGGRTLEGMFLYHTFNRYLTTPRWTSFQRAFRERFGYEPGFASAHAYDAANVLLDGLETTRGAPAGLKSAILTIGSFPGVQGPVTLDRFGDVQRELFLMEVHDGRYVPQEVP